MTFGSLAFAVALLFLLAVAARFHDLRRQEWIERAMQEAIEPGQRREAFESVELSARENRAVLGGYHRDALRLRDEGRAREAAAEMAEGCSAIEGMAAEFLHLLRRLRELARPLSAIVPLEPIGPRSFGTRELRRGAALGNVVHHLLLSGKERVLWHVRALGLAFRYGVLLLRRSTSRLPARADEWRRIEALVRDLDTIGDESVVAARRILLTLDALDRLALQSLHR